MALALFGRKDTLQRALAESWKNEDEKTHLLEELRKTSIKSGAAVPLLWSNDAGVRQVGVEKFLDGCDAASVKVMVGGLAEQSRHARAFALRLFPRIPEKLVEGAMEEMLRDKDVRRSRLAWEIATNLTGPIGQKYLLRALDEATGPSKLAALRKLIQENKPPVIIEHLLKAAKDSDPEVAAAALEAVLSLADERVMDLMLDRFAHGDATAREHAATYLRHQAKLDPLGMRRRMLALLGEGEDATRRLSVEILLATGKHDEVLLEILRFCNDLVGWLRSRILETLLTFGQEVLEPALHLLEHEDEQVRTAALVLAEQFKDPRVTGPVMKLLDAKDWWLRITACDTLGRLGDVRAVPALVQALQDEDTRWAAIDALAHLGNAQALKPLSQLLRDPRAEVRLEVVRAFSRFDDARLLPLLKQVQEKDASTEVRTRAGEVIRDMSARLEVKVEGDTRESIAVDKKKLGNPVDRLLVQARELGASDVHITVGEPPLARLGGELTRLEGWRPLDAEMSKKAIYSILSPRHRKALDETGEVDFCYAIPEVGRYRANAFVQRKGVCAAFRVIANAPPTFAELRLPGRLTELLDYHQGIIVVSGPAGSGKSTSLAAIINLINESKADHVITLEDPIEFVHPVKNALINQREVGQHTESFARALRAALREDPDVIMVGEMRDPETIRKALEAAETGHLVIATMHTTSAIQTIERLVGSFPPEEQQQVRMGLSESLKYVVSQSLIPKKGGGRIAVFEVLKNTFSMGNLIRDDKTYQIPSLMQIGRRVGMQTKDMALMDLVEADLVTPEVAWTRAEKPETFEPLCRPGFIEQQVTPGEQPKEASA